MPRINQPLESVSNEMEEIVGKIPPWLVRWGITVLFCVAVIGLIISRFVKFPDSINGKVIIQAKEQPGKVTVRRETADEEFRFLVREGKMVSPGDTLLLKRNKINDSVEAITTPMSGKIFIVSGRNKENLLEETIWVVPKATKAIVKIKYSNKGAGKVKSGQEVKISLFDYPEAEFGFLEGRIEYVLPIQTDEEIQANVTLNFKSLQTSTNKSLPILPVMEGEGEILLNERSIFSRVFGSLLL